MEALTNSVGAVCTRLEADAPGFFNYRGRNLQFAIERALYFWGMEDAALFGSFEKSLESGPARASEFLDDALRVRLGTHSVSSLPKTVQVVWELIRRTRSLGRYLFNSELNQWYKSGTVETLFFLHDPKFVRFLGSVLNGLGESAGIFATERPHAFQSLDRYRFIKMSPPRITWGKAGKGLARFPYFLEQFDKIVDVILRERPLRVVVAEGNSPVDEIVNQAAASLGVPCVCIQQGWSPIAHPGFRNLSFTSMLVWGKGFAELLRPYSPAGRFVAAGNPSIPEAKIADDIFARKRISFFLQAPNRLISGAAWSAFLDLAGRTAEKNPHVDVLIREHPAHNISNDEKASLKAFPNAVIESASRESLSEVLNKSSLVVSMYSSTIIEGMAAGVLPVIANFSSLPRYWPDLQAAGAAIETNSVEDALAAIARGANDREFHDSFRKGMQECADQFVAARSASAAANIVSAIRRTGAKET